MQEWIGLTAFGVSLAGLLIASYTDWKERIVNDWVSYGLIASGITLFFVNAFLSNEWNLLVASILSAAGTFLGAYALWRFGFWAGGDVKLFTGLAALNPFNWKAFSVIFEQKNFLQTAQLPAFSFSLFIVSVIALLPVGYVFLFGKMVQYQKKPEELLQKIMENASNWLLAAVLTGLFSNLLSGQNEWIAVGITAALLFLFWKIATAIPMFIRYAGAMAGLTAGWLVFGLPFLVSTLELFGVLFIVGILLKTIRNPAAFRVKKKITELKEGDIPAVSIVQTPAGIEIRRKKSGMETVKILIKTIKNQNIKSFPQTIKNLKKYGLNMGENEHEICSANRAAGLEKEQILELIELSAGKKIPDEMEVKESTAFVPAVLVSYVLLNIVGNPFVVIG